MVLFASSSLLFWFLLFPLLSYELSVVVFYAVFLVDLQHKDFQDILLCQKWKVRVPFSPYLILYSAKLDTTDFLLKRKNKNVLLSKYHTILISSQLPDFTFSFFVCLFVLLALSALSDLNISLLSLFNLDTFFYFISFANRVLNTTYYLKCDCSHIYFYS